MQNLIGKFAKPLAAAAVVIIAIAPQRAVAQWSTVHEQFYLPGSFNWQFRRNYPAADKLFNAFDYGHAILYERLWRQPGVPVGRLENDEFDFITKKLLVSPPSLPLEEGAIEVAYVKMAPEAKLMFEWAHLLHRQIYDVLADERLSDTRKDAKIAELIRYYKSRKDLAFSSFPKSMDLMEGQPYSLAFRKGYPKFNGLIWAYHWLQIGLYEPLLAGKNKDERQTGVMAAVARFRQMIEQPPTWMPRVMPMTPAVAPLFTARYPEAAIIFDNLHSMHDVISDILANPSVPRDRKRAEILKAASRYRDDKSFIVSLDDWREMAAMMGVQNMGGPARGFLAEFPAPTVERGAVMSHTSHGASAASGAMQGMQHAMPAADSMKSMDHMHMPGMAHPAAPSATARAMGAEHEQAMHELHMRMMADPVIRARINANPAMRRLMESAMSSGSHTMAPAKASRPTTARKKSSTVTTKARSSTVKKKTAPKKTTPAATKAKTTTKPKPDPHAGMDHSKMEMPVKK